MKRAVWLLVVWGVMMMMGLRSQAESMVAVSDLHLTEATADFAPALSAVRQALEGRQALLLLGDDTNNGKPVEHALLLQWLRETQAATNVEIYVVPGNHDLSRAINAASFAQLYASFGPSRAFSLDQASASCAVMTRGGTCLLLLDTNAADRPGHVAPSGGISPETIAWVDHTLASLPSGTPAIACGHHPLLPESRLQATTGASALVDVLVKHGVGAYLCGHDHGFATVDGVLRQITVGQPQNYPGRCGVITRTADGFAWRTETLYDADDPYYVKLRQGAETLAHTMGRGTLRGTVHEADEDAIEWFAGAFLQYASGELTEASCAQLLADENCQKWREIQTRTVVKGWILNLLEHCPPDARSIDIPNRPKAGE
ncbi:MAG: metallophosphoesterase [Clostridia bacterium]|nr:metallophosphoesterase [Clostridia bacterium]